MKKLSKALAILLTVCMILSMIPTVFADEPAVEGVILYTNDIHTYVDNKVGLKPEDDPNEFLNYASVAQLKKDIKKENDVLLVDAGDHIQGTAYGGMDKGATIIKMMNAAGYDLATLGNHEFDYGMDGMFAATGAADFPYVSCNFYHETEGVPGESVFDAYKVFNVGSLKVAFVGVTTPESFTKSTPKYFQDEDGNYIYGIAGGADGSALYAAVQKAIDKASEEADIVIGLGHLGDDPASDPWNSEDVIANTNGLAAFIDGHSHSTVAKKEVNNKDGKPVILSQTGNYLAAVGKMTILDNGTIDTELITKIEGEDEAVKAIEDAWITEIDGKLGTKIAESEINFTTQYPSPNEAKRAVRSAETNVGDLNADAYYWFTTEAGLEPDMAIMNGGGVRASVEPGDWTYKTCKTVNTFGNVLCVVEITGQQILDALEFGGRFTTGDPSNSVENGGFLQVAGCTYKIDANVPNTVSVDDKNVWLAGPADGAYRVSDVKIYNRETKTYEPLDLAKTYRVAGTNYTLYDCGDGFNMFQGGKHVLDGISEDYLAMAAYVQAFTDTDENEYGNIASANSPLAAYEGYLLNYEAPEGAGRIEIDPYIAPAWDQKVTIGGTELNVWFTKYGNTYCDCTVDHFSKTDDNGFGFAVGDIVTVKFLDQELQLPVVNNYSDVDSGLPCIKLGTNNYVEFAINMGNFGSTYGLVNIVKGDDGVYTVTAKEGVTFPVEITFEMYEKEGYLAEYLLHQLSRTNNREDYADLTDAEFANFRQITTTGMGDHLYRGSSPINPEIGRNTYADAAIKAAGVNVIMNLADSKEIAEGYEGFAESYYAGQNIKYLNLGVDFTADDFKAGLAEGLKFFAENEGVYYVHCSEGKDRAGFVSALLECLMGATYDEVVADYMVTYYNYYGVEEGSEQYNAIAASNIVKTLTTAFGAEDLKTADLAAGAEAYIKSLGLNDDEIAALKYNLADHFVNPFKDVKENDWFYDVVMKMYKAGIIKGASKNTFEPESNVTRAEFVTMLYRYDGENKAEVTTPFTDVKSDFWYTDAITWAYANKIVNGMTPTTFEPDTYITREQIVTILFRYAQYANLDTTASKELDAFKDADKVSDWALDAMKWAVANGILNGDEKSRINPQNNATRAEAAALIARLDNLAPAEDVSILYTNDVHTYIDNKVGLGEGDDPDEHLNYASVAKLKKDIAAENDVLLVDAGDHIQGTAYGGMDNGASIIAMMNAAGYDLATLGNHEFDYGMDGMFAAINAADFPYVSCNFYNEKDGVAGDPVLDSYKVFNAGGRRIAIIGITTPESFTKSTPKYFQDAEGNYIYGIAGGADGSALYAAVQKAIDEASKEADIVIALGHLGDDPASDPWNSEDVIANTSGLTAFIDGHSHSSVEKTEIKDKDGNAVILTQTGNYLNAIGKMTIAADGSVSTEFVTKVEGEDEAVKAIEDAWIAKVDEQLNQKIAESDINFTITYENGNRAIRSTETNLGDLNADAYYWFTTEAGLEPDMAIMNGGGIRAKVDAGDWTYKTCKTVNTFGNVLCVVEISGQQILDALEFGARFTTGDPDNLKENGGFLQVAGCTYEIDTTVANTVKVDDKSVWTGGPDAYRVCNVKIYNRETKTYEPLDLEKTYRVAGTNYTLYDCGDGFDMFKGGKHVLDGISEDYLAMAAYVQAFADTDENEYGNIATANSPLAAYEGYLLNYEAAFGAGRIVIK